MTETPDAQSRIREDLDRLARSRRVRFCTAFVLCLALGLGLGFGLGRAQAQVDPGRFAMLIATLCGVGGLSLALVFGLVFPAERSLRVLVAVLVTVGLVAILGVASESASPQAVGLHCLLEGSELTFVALVVVLVLGRGGRLRRHGPQSVLLGLGAAFCTLPMLQLACPDRSLGHLLLWHGGVLVLGIVLADVLRRLLRDD